jgi:hypothetical protein
VTTAQLPRSGSTIARPDVTALLPYFLQTATGKVLPILKALRVWVFVAKITDGFKVGMDVLPTCDTTVDLKRHVLQIGEDLLLWRPGASLLTTARGRLILARCERVVTALLGSQSEAVKCRVHPARTLVHARREVPVRFTNVRRCSHYGQCEQVTLAAPVGNFLISLVTINITMNNIP